MKKNLNISLWFVLFVLNTSFVFAGECITSDEELYKGTFAFYDAAKKVKAEETVEYGGWGLECWEGNAELDAKLKKLLKEMIFDSRLHPSDVVTALRDYKTVFNDTDQLREEMKKKQGKSRHTLIVAILDENSKSIIIPSGETLSFPEDVDFIDGTANIRAKPKGKVVAYLPDNTKVKVLKREGKWFEVEADEGRGWTYKGNLVGMNAHAVDSVGFSLLSRAAYMGYIETVSFLLHKGANPASIDKFGRNSLHWAADGSFAKMGGIELALFKLIADGEGIDINLKDNDGDTLLLIAIKNGRLDMVNLMLSMDKIDVNLQGKDGLTPLILAVKHGRKDIVNELLSEKAIDVNLPDNQGKVPLTYAIMRGRYDVTNGLLNSEGIELDKADKEGKTPLYQAIANRKDFLAKILLEKNTRKDIVTIDGKNLYHAVFEAYSRYYSAPKPDLIKLLSAYKEIDVNKADKEGNTPLSLAIGKKSVEIVKLFLSVEGLDLTAKDYLGMAGYKIKVLLLDREDININIPGYNGETLLFANNVEIAKKILARNPDLEIENEDGDTALIHHIKQNNVDMVALLITAEGIDLNHPDRFQEHEKRTPLAIARGRKRGYMVKLLEEAGAQEVKRLGGPDKSPEGIPQELLKNKLADEAIQFYRSYLRQRNQQAIDYLNEGKPDDAMKILEFVLSEMISEEEGSIKKYSIDQRKIARKTFTLIRRYYKQHPRSSSQWFKDLDEGNKAYYTKADKKIKTVLSGKYATLPDGELKDHPPMTPILILRKYMAANAIDALYMIHKGERGDAIEFMKDVVSRSSLKY